jgi:hypothetical protein
MRSGFRIFGFSYIGRAGQTTVTLCAQRVERWVCIAVKTLSEDPSAPPPRFPPPLLAQVIN